MIHIPSEEISQPLLHADSLGFTFVWKGHFLRGVFPDSIDLAKSYFDTGFLEEVTDKELFPKTWVSEFENEQFGMIIEHEMIAPVLYATEWNSAMLKDAALMVLDIAEIGWRYGFNMVDCHKKNVLFKNNRPLYVDLGSFIPREKGSTGWKPYRNFLESYTYILDIWAKGCPQLAKRMMSPGVTLHTSDYLAWKHPLFRIFPLLLSLYTKLCKANNDIAIKGNGKLNLHRKITKIISNWLKPAASQHFNRLRRRIKRINVNKSIAINRNQSFDPCFIGKVDAITCINLPNAQVIRELQQKGVRNIISVHELDSVSNSEYCEIKSITSVSYPLMDGGVIVRNKLPEGRLQSDCVLAYCDNVAKGKFALHNNLVYLDYCMTYSTRGIMYVLLPKPNEKMLDLLCEMWTINKISKEGTMIEVVRSH